MFMAFWNKNSGDDLQNNKPSPPQSVPSQTLQNRFQQLMKNSARTPAIDMAIQISDLILEQAVMERTSDVHFEYQGQNLRVRYRVDGILQDVLKLARDKNIPITQRLRVLAGFDPEPPTSYRTEEGRFQKNLAGRQIQFRVSVFPAINGEKLVLRVFDRSQMGLTLDQLGFSEEVLKKVKELAFNPYGIFVVTGATGSGKTTSLYAMARTVNSSMVNILSLEDPVEYRLDGINQAQVNPKTGFSWAEGLRTILRQDPDVILLGEVRDSETADIALRTALTGHMIFTTLHTISAPGAIERLFEMGIQPYLIASSLVCCMAQRLVRKICPKCAQKNQPLTGEEASEFVKNLNPVEAKFIKEVLLKPDAGFVNQKGCPDCRNTGYVGRTGIFEFMVMNEDLRKKILSKGTTDDIRRTAIEMGMKTMLADGIEKASKGITTMREVLRVTATMV
jgi:type II secretory ATPase GspE/PulE/Tfp pilus assembly ATPase PilB-like protein